MGRRVICLIPAIDAMLEITNLVENYVNSMQEVENAYGVNHVSIG